MANIDQLLKMLDSPKASIRHEACEELRVSPEITPEALSALQNALNDPDSSVVESARSALRLHLPPRPQDDLKETSPSTIQEASTQMPVTPPAIGKKFGIRAGAYLIDVLVTSINDFLVSFAVGLLAALIFEISAIDYSIVESPSWFSFVILILLDVAYFSVFEWLYGATPGKTILQMRVIKANGQKCDFRSAFIRAIYRYIDGILFGIIALVNMKRPWYQRLGDKRAGTLVVGSRASIIKEFRPWWRFFIAAAIYFALSISLLSLLALYSFRFQGFQPSAF